MNQLPKTSYFRKENQKQFLDLNISSISIIKNYRILIKISPSGRAEVHHFAPPFTSLRIPSTDAKHNSIEPT